MKAMEFKVVRADTLIGLNIEYNGWKISSDWLSDIERESLADQLEQTAKTLREGGEKWASITN